MHPLVLTTIALSVIGLWSPLARAGTPLEREYEVRAALLFSFAKFVQWPPHAQGEGEATLSFCVIGQTPFISTLREKLSGKTVRGRAVDVQGFDSAGRATSCNLVFFSPEATGQVGAFFRSADARGVLTVGADDEFLGQGGMINLTRNRGKLRFRISLDAIQGAGLTMDARFISLADSR